LNARCPPNLKTLLPLLAGAPASAQRTGTEPAVYNCLKAATRVRFRPETGAAGHSDRALTRCRDSNPAAIHGRSADLHRFMMNRFHQGTAFVLELIIVLIQVIDLAFLFGPWV